MLAAIGQQQGLVKLHVSPRCWCTPSAAAYSALTASSHLQQLVLGGWEFLTATWQQMFPPTRRLPELSYLCLYSGEGPLQPLSQADMQAMVSCCPGLASLELMRQLPVETAKPLQQLTGLTHLCVCASFQDSTPSIAQLTGLQGLVLHSTRQADQVTASGLLQLTALQQLRNIEIHADEATLDPGLLSLRRSLSCLVVSNKVSMPASIPSMSVTAYQQHTHPH